MLIKLFAHDISERLQKSTHSPEKDWNFAGKMCQKLECFCITEKARGEIQQ